MNAVGVVCMRRVFIASTQDSPVEGVKNHHGTVHTGRELHRRKERKVSTSSVYVKSVNVKSVSIKHVYTHRRQGIVGEILIIVNC